MATEAPDEAVLAALRRVIADPKSRPSTVVRAAEELGRWEMRLYGRTETPTAETPARDPFEWLDDLEARRRRAARR